MIRSFVASVISIVLVTTCLSTASAKSNPNQNSLVCVYKKCADHYDVPWTLLAGIDRYAELTKSKTDHDNAPYYGLQVPWSVWSGAANPDTMDVTPVHIQLFGGLGTDWDHDQMAAPWVQADRIASMAAWLDAEGGEEDVEQAVWQLIQDPVGMDRIFSFAQIFQKYGLNPKGNCFPIAKRYNYSIKHSFGAGRSFGGRRSHEGVDIFADYGTPVLACSYGYVELLGWNRFGGWRLGIRDANNYYYYYAHLSNFARGVKQGSLVRPGDIVGYVGSTGYGPPGTSGKFPPHLHFGIYRDGGRREWAFSPSSLLRQWERQKQEIHTFRATETLE